MTIYCTRLTYVDNYLKNTYYSCIQKHRHVYNMLLLYFIVRGKQSCRVLIPDGIQVRTSVNKLKSYASPESLILLPWFFPETLICCLSVTHNYHMSQPYNSQHFMSNPPYCLPYNLCDNKFENLELD